LVEAFTYPTVSYQTVQQGTIDNTVFYTGVILRDEVVYQDTVSGDLYYTAAEGEKVKKGTEICYTLEQNISSLLSRLESVDESLYAIQQNREDLTTYQKELYLLNRNAEEEINQFYYLYEGKSTQPLYTLRNQLNKIIQQKSTIYTIDQTDTTVGLQEDKKNLEQQIGGLANSFVTQDAGTVSYQIDGFEYLTLEAFQEMTLTSFQKFLKKENPKTESIDEIDAIPLFKIIKNHAWQLVAYLTKEEATLYTLGETYACKLEGAYTEPILFTLLEKNEKEDGFQIVLESNQQLTNFLNQRIVRFSIGENRAEGLKIPLDAIVERTMIGIPEDYVVEKGEEIGVLRAVGEINEFVPVVVQYTKEIDGVNVSYFVQQLDQAKTLHVNEEILHPMTQEKYQVNDVCIVKGVYTINGRYAKFKEVNISLANDGYAIISDDSQLKAYDQIISNPKYIKEEQLLKHMNIQNE
jgi:hypothetical protein